MAKYIGVFWEFSKNSLNLITFLPIPHNFKGKENREE